ncbi:Gfo/Idh/MocA family oxidoreductase [Treponema sp.]
MERIPVAIVGLGRIASLLEDDPLREKPCTHAGAVAANPDCALLAGADLDEARRPAFASTWGVRVYDDAEEMILKEKPGILVIATHPDSHLRYCALAEELDLPVVICEKPLADSLRSARKIAAIHRRGRVRILTNHERRYSEDYRLAKGLLDSERLGRLLGVRCTLYMGKARRLLDVLWHDGTHLVDALAFLTGALPRHRRIWGAALRAREGTSFMGGDLLLGAGARVPFLFELGVGRDHLVFELEFSCERGRLRIGNGVYEVWESEESSYASGFRSLKKCNDAFSGPTGYFSNMIKDAAACYRDSARQPVSSAEDGLAVIEYLHSIQRWGRPQ